MSEYRIRPLSTHAELVACVELQRETWGRDFAEIVCPSMLKISRRVGGVSAGAFDERDQLIGFVYGITGIDAGKPVHWSHMLAVRSGAQSRGIGRALKEYQREEVLALGVDVMYWTYDPLVARNAHLNFNVLGVRAVEYVVDMYGETESILHRGIGTDRMVVAWDLGRGKAVTTARADGTRRIEIPMDINALQRADPVRAAEWRSVTRPQFLTGCRVCGFTVDAARGTAYYTVASG